MDLRLQQEVTRLERQPLEKLHSSQQEATSLERQTIGKVPDTKQETERV
jgi:hypothetical protein